MPLPGLTNPTPVLAAAGQTALCAKSQGHLCMAVSPPTSNFGVSSDFKASSS